MLKGRSRCGSHEKGFMTYGETIECAYLAKVPFMHMSHGFEFLTLGYADFLKIFLFTNERT